MALYTVTTGNTILAADVNQLVNVLQRASGQVETGKYFIALPVQNGWQISQFMSPLSRVSTPVSVTIDTVDASPTNCGSPATALLTANGFQVKANGNTTANVANVGGNYTIQY